MGNEMKKTFLLTFLSLSLFVCFYTENAAARIAADKFNDFDGDGKTDFRVRRYVNGTEVINYDWYILRSGDGGYNVTRWGMLNLQNPMQDDLPVSGDFDGDGKTDIAVWRQVFANPAVPTYFYILRSSDSTFLA